MEKTKELLRAKFYSETNNTILNTSKYEEWLESIQTKDINEKLIIENEYLRDKMDQALSIIYKGLSSKVN